MFVGRPPVKMRARGSQQTGRPLFTGLCQAAFEPRDSGGLQSALPPPPPTPPNKHAPSICCFLQESGGDCGLHQSAGAGAVGTLAQTNEHRPVLSGTSVAANHNSLSPGRLSPGQPQHVIHVHPAHETRRNTDLLENDFPSTGVTANVCCISGKCSWL